MAAPTRIILPPTSAVATAVFGVVVIHTHVVRCHPHIDNMAGKLVDVEV